jgi:hemerythrin-like metal-binding protein
VTCVKATSDRFAYAYRALLLEFLMPNLVWSADIELDMPVMDDTHREFVDLLGVTEAADDGSLLTRWAALIAHTEAHFGREDAWMQATHFAASNCHSAQHDMVLKTMRAGLHYGEAGHLALVRQMVHELGPWFVQHAQSMDAALATHLERVGFDPVTGTINRPDALPHEQIHGCGGATCADTAADTPALHAAAH